MSSASTRPSDAPTPPSGFAELGVPAALVKSLSRQGITEPFAIQTATMPDALSGRDVLGRAQTGSGKTLAFGLPMIARLTDKTARRNHPLGLVLVPTRELAMQVNDTLAPLAQAVGLDVRLVAGGMPYSRQIEALRRGVEILVATPGRLVDLIQQGNCNLSDVEISVLDEADHMADLGFLPVVTELLEQVRPDGQRLLFSATLDNGIDKLVKRFLSDPVRHSTEEATASVSTMDHHLLLVHPEDKAAVTAQIAAREGRTIMFVRTKHGADRLATTLARQGVAAGSLHGGKTQAARTKALDAFRAGRVPVLVATDVAARGIHVDDVSLVVHVDPPGEHKDYLHRAGRTARAGESGTVVTLVLPHQQRDVDLMTTRAGVTPERTKVRPGATELFTVTGARTPSGIPVIEPAEPNSARRTGRPPRSGGYKGAGYQGGGYQGKAASGGGRGQGSSRAH
ncbi:MAG: DEAD/DEAH box helicase [Actinobacteria bacterium]|uniref:Unannotated protein n=1 Tax=freshwater metagenome TaxID=449393 RepID=A0A6J7RHC4_9ZZZZ|nr:DEAD/DEAH box helicase [Actinomycetota bacterium]